MTSDNNNERVRQAAERSTPPLRPDVRKRALWAAMTTMRRRSPLRILTLLALILLLLTSLVYVAVRWFPSEDNWLR